MKIFFIYKKTIFLCFFIILLILIGTGLSFLSSAIPTSATPVSSSFAKRVSTLTTEDEKHCFLTFDDGPNPAITPKVLDILKEEDVKATFFVIGKWVDLYPEIVKRAYEEGHYIANHSYSHNHSVLYQNFEEEIQKTDIAIGNAIGSSYCSYVFRFPNGYLTPMYQKEKKACLSKLSQMNYTYLDWNCLNEDSVKKYTSAQLLQNLKQSAKNKNTLVILMHDTKDVSNSSLALKSSISYLKSEGYEFQNLYDLIP